MSKRKKTTQPGSTYGDSAAGRATSAFMADNSRTRSSVPDSVNAPREVDFALLTINRTEDEAVRTVFGKSIFKAENRLSLFSGNYAWGHIRNGLNKRAVILHASTNDMKGPTRATALVAELDSRFKPRYLLILGTAGGIRAHKVDYANIVFSRQVHAGYQQLLDREDEVSGPGDHDPQSRPCGRKEPCSSVEVHLFDDPVQPPSDQLYLHAAKIATEWKPPARINTSKQKPRNDIPDGKAPWKIGIDEILAPISTMWGQETGGEDLESVAWFQELRNAIEASTLAGKCEPISAEIFSGSYLVDGKNSELFKAIKTTFPKVGAIEMEVGAIAQAALRSVQVDRYVGYLAIKGISDVVDSGVPKRFRKPLRKSLSLYASQLSAAFAKRFVETWKGDELRTIGRVSLVPPRYAYDLHEFSRKRRVSNSIVLDGMNLREYSELLKKLCDLEHVSSIWTFSYLAPYRFFAEMYDEIPHDQRQGFELQGRNATGSAYNEDLEKAQKWVQYMKADRERIPKVLRRSFPHFDVFMDVARKPGKEVVRILHKGEKWEEENCIFLDYFSAVTGPRTKIRSHAIDGKSLDFVEGWLRSDHVVLDEELLLEYDRQERRLLVTYLDPGPIGMRLLFRNFKRHCEQLSTIEAEFGRETVRIREAHQKSSCPRCGNGGGMNGREQPPSKNADVRKESIRP